MNLLKQLQTVTFHRAFVDLGGSINAALMLSNALYWTNRLPAERDGWFYKAKAEWEQETGLTRREQDKARQQLEERGLVEVRRAKVSEEECITALWFRVKLDALQQRLSGDQTAESAFCQTAESATTKSTKAPFGLLIEKRTSITTSPPPPPRVASFMPDDWMPAGSVYPVLQAAGISPEFAQACIAEFRQYWMQRGDARSDWNAVFIRQCRNEFAFQTQQQESRHEQTRRRVSGPSAQQSGRGRKESVAERCARYERFAAGLDASINGENAPGNAYDAIAGDFQRH